MTEDQIEKMAAAVLAERVKLSGREAPYGLYSYAVFCIRDFRDVLSDSYGAVIERFDDEDSARRRYDILTEMHYLKIAFEAVK